VSRTSGFVRRPGVSTRSWPNGCRGMFRSRPVYNRARLAGTPGNWVDRTPRRRTGRRGKDRDQRIAKVRVAGSNPVVRSRWA
jgi:hypothetical protein